MAKHNRSELILVVGDTIVEKQPKTTQGRTNIEQFNNRKHGGEGKILSRRKPSEKTLKKIKEAA